MKRIVLICWLCAAMVLSLGAKADAVTLTPVEVSRLLAHADSHQSDGSGGTLLDSDEAEWKVPTGPLGSPDALAEADPIGLSADGWTQDGDSSFAIARSQMADAGGWTTPDNNDTFALTGLSQATPDPAPFGPEGWGYSVSYALITYETAPSAGDSVGDPMTVTLDVTIFGLLSAEDNSEYFLDVGYALGTGLTDYDPVLSDPANEANPGIGQFDQYFFLRESGPSFGFLPMIPDSLTYIGVVGDQVQFLLAMSSFSDSSGGHSMASGIVGATVTATAIPEPATLLLLGTGLTGLGFVRRRRRADG